MAIIPTKPVNVWCIPESPGRDAEVHIPSDFSGFVKLPDGHVAKYLNGVLIAHSKDLPEPDVGDFVSLDTHGLFSDRHGTVTAIQGKERKEYIVSLLSGSIVGVTRQHIIAFQPKREKVLAEASAKIEAAAIRAANQRALMMAQKPTHPNGACVHCFQPVGARHSFDCPVLSSPVSMKLECTCPTLSDGHHNGCPLKKD